ncbi:hypothetical protein [Spiractinospora alimapuensis]|uniref:hypothetical protein n=1 Tax=Spiractinospora alimapuensis TaxID=2820884 RepID=UPI00374448BC
MSEPTQRPALLSTAGTTGAGSPPPTEQEPRPGADATPHVRSGADLARRALAEARAAGSAGRHRHRTDAVADRGPVGHAPIPRRSTRRSGPG